MGERLVKARPHDWIISKKIILGLLIFGLVIFILGIILTSVGSPRAVYATGKALLGVGICFLSICLLLCLYAHLVWYVVDEETQTWEGDSIKTSGVDGVKISDGIPGVFDGEMVDGGYPTKVYDKNRLTPQPSPKRVRISPTTHIVDDGASGVRERTVPTIITSSDDTPRSAIKATAIAVAVGSEAPNRQQHHQTQQQLQMQQQQQMQQHHQHKEQQHALKQQELQQQLLQQHQLQQQEQHRQQQQHQEQQKHLQQKHQQEQHQQQQKHLQQQQQQLQQLQQQYHSHYYQPTQVTSTGQQPKLDQSQAPGYADYEPVTGRIEPVRNIVPELQSNSQHQIPVIVSSVGPADSHLPPTGANAPRVTVGAQLKPIPVDTFTINRGVPYTSTPIPRSPVDSGFTYQQQQQQHYQTLIRQQPPIQQNQPLIHQQVHQSVQRTPASDEPKQPLLDAPSSSQSHSQSKPASNGDRIFTATAVTNASQQSKTVIEDDDYDEANNMPIMGSYPRRQWLQDLDNPPEPVPLQYPSAKRPMTFRNTSSSKVSIYDNVTLPYLDNQ